MILPSKNFILINLRGIPFVITEDVSPIINFQINSSFVTPPTNFTDAGFYLDDIKNIKNNFDEFTIEFDLIYNSVDLHPDKKFHALSLSRTLGFAAFKNLVRANAYVNIPKILNVCSIISTQLVEPVCLLRSVTESQQGFGKTRVGLNFLPVTLLKTPSGSTDSINTSAAGQVTQSIFS